MNYSLLILFIVLNIVNVILQTVKSIVTIKCKAFPAAVVNAIAYGLYTVVIVYMVCDLPLLVKALIVGGANLVGVYAVKIFETKKEKENLWKVEATIKNTNYNSKLVKELRDAGISMNCIPVERWIVVNCFCATKEQSKITKEILQKYDAKFFVSESKIL